MVIQRIGPLSTAKVAGVLYAGLGLLFGAIFSLMAMLGGMATDEAGGAAFGAIFGVGAIIFFPLLYGAMGFVMAALMAWLFNIAAGIAGGVEVDTQ
jgi:hypothetical protein